MKDHDLNSVHQDGAQASSSPRRLIALASVLLLAAAGCTSHAPAPKEGVVDLLQQDWQHVPGVTADGDGLRVTATARTILDRDSGGRQPNPPLNLAGTHLVTEGDVTQLWHLKLAYRAGQDGSVSRCRST